ncbi:MAG: ABC transporter ATP-binding protein [Sphaerochaetaceae bacterium]
MIKLLKKMKGREWLMAIICTLLVLAQIYFDLKLPDYMSDLTVLIETQGSQISDVLTTGVKMLLCALISAAFAIGCGFLASKTAAGLSYTIRDEVFARVSGFGQKEMLGFSVPSLINRTTNDITQIQMLVAMGLQLMIKAPVMAVWAIIKIVNKNWTLSVITAGFVAAILAMMAIVIILVVPRFKKVQKLTDQVNLVARENLTGINVVHAFNAEEYQNDKFNKANQNLMNTQLFNQRTFAVMMPFVNFAMNALSLVIMWVGSSIVNDVPAAQIAMRVSTFGNIVVFGTYATYVVMSLMMLVMIFMFLPAAQVSAGRINEVLQTKASVVQGSNNQGGPEKGTVEFRNASFHYPSSDKDVIENISFKVGHGQTAAFIGATGSGKTTLVSLVARFYDATAGTVLVDGQDVKDYTFDALYDRVGYITQKPVLFSASIKDNVLYGESRGEKTAENAEEAIRIAQADEFVQKMGGLDSAIAQSGSNISGGQKQRISIARAIARKPEILIFDDSFSALDYKTDAALRKELETKLSDTTKLIVAQRIGTVRHADMIIVLDEGKMVGIGTHEELMKDCKVYREIALSQLSAQELEG